MKKISSLTLFFTLLCIQQTFAQNEVERQRSSLMGINEFGVVINIEQPSSLDDPSLNAGIIREGILKKISSLPVTILEDSILRKSENFPILHLHINIMEASDNLYPFTIEMNFYQPVKLILNGDLETMAITWNKSQIGLVSKDMVNVIAEESIYASELFLEEFNRVNL